jgi:flavin reductase (DIM6/NTAB) family NADH-FMN oxidoreductase RutF
LGELSAEHFRQVMAHVPTSVAVVAGVVDGRPMGLSVGTFVPVSLEPPLVGFFVARTSKSWPPINATGSFCVSILSRDQAEVSSRFAVSEADKFEGIAWHPAPSGNPVLAGAVAFVDCDIERVVETGDHVLVLGAVRDMGVGTGQSPLVHHRRSYRAVAEDYEGPAGDDW